MPSTIFSIPNAVRAKAIAAVTPAVLTKDPSRLFTTR